jgi:hypothetical protein
MVSKEINIGGENRPVYFGLAALAKLEQLTGVRISGMDKMLADLSIDNLISFVFAGLYGGHKKERKDIDFSIDDVMDWLDDYMESGQNIETLMEVYMSCMPLMKNEETKPASKKKG